MLVEKEVIRPGTYWYRDQDSGEPRKLVVTPKLTRYWHEQGNAMLAANLTVPVPCEHDFDAHPMTPADKLLNNAGWVKSYSLKGDTLFGQVDVTDADVARKLPHTIRWTSPWINSFTDGQGKEWKNVISHLALTTRPRIVNQQPFGSIAAALSMATPTEQMPPSAFHLSRAGLLLGDGQPAYPMAFSIWSGGTPLATGNQIRDPSGRWSKGGSGHSAVKEVETAQAEGGNYSSETKEHGSATIKASKRAMRSGITTHHAEAAEAHEKAARTMMGVHDRHAGSERAHHYSRIAKAHLKARDEHHQHAGGHPDKYSSSMDLGFAISENDPLPTDNQTDVDAAFAWSPEARAKAAESRKRNAATRKTAKVGGGVGVSTPESAHEHSQAAHEQSYDTQENSHHSREAMRASSNAQKHSSDGNHQQAANHHHEAAGHHVRMAQEHHAAGRHSAAHMHAEAAARHFAAARRQLGAYNMKSGKAMSAALGDVSPQKAKKGKPDIEPDNDDGSDDLDDDGVDDDFEDDDATGNAPPPTDDDNIDLPPFDSASGDVSMVELLCDLLGALGITVEPGADEETFKRQLYNAAMTEIHNLTGKAKAGEEQQRTNPPGQPPNNPKPKPGQQPNPLVQQEQQPMFMSLDEIKKLDEPLRSVALSMHAETQRATAKATAAEAVLNSLRDKTLKEENEKRGKRVSLLGRLSPRVKADLDAMVALPGMALSMGDGGAVVDPMASTLAVLEKGLADIPRLLVADAAALTMQPHPQDADMLTDARSDEIADGMARQMGCGPVQKAG